MVVAVRHRVMQSMVLVVVAVRGVEAERHGPRRLPAHRQPAFHTPSIILVIVIISVVIVISSKISLSESITCFLFVFNCLVFVSHELNSSWPLAEAC